MSSEAIYPYETRLNILHQPMEVIDVNHLVETTRVKWFNQTLCKVNDSVVRVGVIEGEYHWHKHGSEARQNSSRSEDFQLNKGECR